jgi:hypothetical protein
LEVFTQEVIAAITSDPWVRFKGFPIEIPDAVAGLKSYPSSTDAY